MSYAHNGNPTFVRIGEMRYKAEFHKPEAPPELGDRVYDTRTAETGTVVADGHGFKGVVYSVGSERSDDPAHCFAPVRFPMHGLVHPDIAAHARANPATEYPEAVLSGRDIGGRYNAQ